MHIRHSRAGGNPGQGVGMGSRLHGNDGRRRRTHTTTPARGVTQGSPKAGTLHNSAEGMTIVVQPVVPAKAGTLHNRHSRAGGNPEVGYPARKPTHLHDICFPQAALRKGLRRAGTLHNPAEGMTIVVATRRSHESGNLAQPSFPRRRESIPGIVRHHDPGSSPSGWPSRPGGETGTSGPLDR